MDLKEAGTFNGTPVLVEQPSTVQEMEEAYFAGYSNCFDDLLRNGMCLGCGDAEATHGDLCEACHNGRAV
jgi:hypothetical protein